MKSIPKHDVRGNAGMIALWLLVGIAIVAVIGGGYFAYTLSTGTEGTGTGGSSSTTQTIVQDTATATKAGKVSSLGVFVRDIENNDVNTKVAVPVYCQDDEGSFIIDGTSSSTTAEIPAKTEIGKSVTCYAFNATYQSNPKTIQIDGESPHLVIDAFRTLGAGSGHLQFYDDTFQTGTGGAVNISAGSDATDTFQKLRFTVNNSDTAYQLGGFYFDTVTGTNVSEIDVSGSAQLSGLDKSSTLIVSSDLSTKVTSRKDQWDFVFEIDDDSSKSGNQALMLHENDYLESGSVQVTANGNGCLATSPADLVTSYAFMKGYYRSNKEQAVNYGHETDSTSPSVIASDITGDTFYCTA